MLRQRFLFQEKSVTVQIEELPNKTFVASKVCFCVLSQTWKFGQFVSLSLLQYWGIKWGLGWSSVLNPPGWRSINLYWCISSSSGPSSCSSAADWSHTRLSSCWHTEFSFSSRTWQPCSPYKPAPWPLLSNFQFFFFLQDNIHRIWHLIMEIPVRTHC